VYNPHDQRRQLCGYDLLFLNKKNLTSLGNSRIRMIELQKPVKNRLEGGLRISLLGGFFIHQGENTLGPDCFRLRKACDLVKLLALAPRHRLQRDQILEWLWPDHSPEASANSLHQALHFARLVLDALQPPGHIHFEIDIVHFFSDPGLWVDVEAFEAAAIQASESLDTTLYQAALDLYNGELLPENRYDEWVLLRRENLQQTYLDLLLGQAKLYESKGEYKAAISAFQRIISVDPLLEEAHAGLIYGFALSGQRSQALRQYQLLKDILQKNYHAEPDPETTRMHKLILEGKYQE